jgi:hypothetical protein
MRDKRAAGTAGHLSYYVVVQLVIWEEQAPLAACAAHCAC